MKLILYFSLNATMQSKIIDINHHQRFEAKYIVSDLQAEAIKDFIQPHVIPDPNAQNGAAYPVYSMYLDSRDLRLYWMSSYGLKNRFKLRVRWYDGKGAEPFFLEIKRRIDGLVQKQRVRIDRDSLERFLGQRQAVSLNLDLFNEQERYNMLQFFDYTKYLNAEPKIMVRYIREAYVFKHEQRTRITFDNRIQCLSLPSFYRSLNLSNQDWDQVFDLPVVLEIKFTDSFPRWIQNVVREFGLLRDSLAKYLFCTQELKKHGRIITA